MTRFDRHLFRQIAAPFCAALAIVVALVFFSQTRRMSTAALGAGLTFEDGFVLMLAALPPFIVIAAPIACLFAIVVALGRMKREGEIDAISNAGVGPFRLACVPIAFGVGVACLTWPVAYFGEPFALRALYARIIDVGLRNVSRAFLPQEFNDDLRGIAMHVEGVDADGRLHDVVLFDEREPTESVIAMAKSATIDAARGTEICFVLEDGELHPGMSSATGDYARVRFRRAEWTIDVARELRERTRFIASLSRLDSDELAAAVRALPHDTRERRKIQKVYGRRSALPSMCAVFSLAGAAIALSLGRRSWLQSASAALVTIAAYYMLMRIGDLAVLELPGSAFFAVWLPNVIVAAVGGLALARAGRPRT